MMDQKTVAHAVVALVASVEVWLENLKQGEFNLEMKHSKKTFVNCLSGVAQLQHFK